MTNYKCSIHGDNGTPDCKECCENLKRLCEDNNAYISATEEDKELLGLN